MNVCWLFIYFIMFFLSSNYQNIKHENHKRQRTQRCKLQARAKTKENPLLIESNQSEISKTQDQDCHKDSSQPSSKPPPTSHSQQKSILVKSQKSGQLSEFQPRKLRVCSSQETASENSHVWTEIRAENRNSLLWLLKFSF